MPCRHRRRRGTALLILKLSNGWRWEVTFTPWLLYLLQKQHQVPIEEEAGWVPEPVSTLWKKRKLSCNCQELMNCLISSTGHSPVILTKLAISLNNIHAQKSTGFPTNSLSQGHFQSTIHSHTHLYRVHSCHCHATSKFSLVYYLDKRLKLFSWRGTATLNCCTHILRHQHYTNHNHG